MQHEQELLTVLSKHVLNVNPETLTELLPRLHDETPPSRRSRPRTVDDSDDDIVDLPRWQKDLIDNGDDVLSNSDRSNSNVGTAAESCKPSFVGCVCVRVRACVHDGVCDTLC